MMTAVILATFTSRALSADTIYTLKLRRRGIDFDQALVNRHLATTPRPGPWLTPTPPPDRRDEQ
jgi:CIC family chloride channel protein